MIIQKSTIIHMSSLNCIIVIFELDCVFLATYSKCYSFENIAFNKYFFKKKEKRRKIDIQCTLIIFLFLLTYVHFQQFSILNL